MELRKSNKKTQKLTKIYRYQSLKQRNKTGLVVSLGITVNPTQFRNNSRVIAKVWELSKAILCNKIEKMSSVSIMFKLRE
jgi:hypothetical protein